MINIDKIFDIDNDNNNKNTHNSINITNPILYIFIGGDGSDILKTIYDFNESKDLNSTGAVEYINIGTKFCDYTNNNNVLMPECEEENLKKRRAKIYNEFNKYDEILKMISYIELKFLERSYSVPIRRRIHFIVEASNEYSCILKKVVDTTEKFLLSRSLAPVIDIFAIIDDKPDCTDTKKASTYLLLQELKELDRCVNMIYLLSNLNSSRTISKQKELYTSIARTAIVKEFDYTQQPYDFSYHEGRIIENVKNIPHEKRGIFYSLGLKIIERPKDALQFVALSVAIDRNDSTNQDTIDESASQFRKGFLQILNQISKNPLCSNIFMESEHISSIMISNEMLYDNCGTNGELISSYFGTSLDKYFEYNLEDNLSFNPNDAKIYIDKYFESYVQNPQIGYFAAVDIIKEVKRQLDEIETSLEKSSYENQIKFDNWKKQTFLYKKKFFDSKYQPALDIANEYIMHLYKIFIPSSILQTFVDFKQKLESLIDSSNLLIHELEISKKKLIDIAESRLSDEKGELIKNNFVNYYSNAFKRAIQNNYSDYFESVYSKIFSLTQEDVNIFYTECVKYIKSILETPEFNLAVYDEISNRLIDDKKGEYNESVVNDLFNKEIMDDKFYFVKLINEKNFYSNICVLTDNNSIIKKISSSDINYIVYSGEARLEILYFIGTFNDDSLAYGNIYKEAYENLGDEADANI